MTINHFADETDIKIYFHMKNHYKKIRNVKSAIDNSTPQGFIKAVSTPPNSARSWKTCNFEESHVRKCSHVSAHNIPIKQYNGSAETKSDTLLRSTSLPPRPTTRRHPYEMPLKLQSKSRSQSTVLMTRKDSLVRFNVKKRKSNVSIRKNRIPAEASTVQKEVNVVFLKENVLENCDTTGSSQSKQTKSTESCEPVNKSRLEEHEYLHFLLKITEDIILNNFYTNEDIEKVFQAHIEANKDHLKMDKMEAQLARLCAELNIPDKFSENKLENKECYQNFFETHSPIPKVQDLTNCECTTIRKLEINNKQLNKLDDIFKSEELNNVFDLENKIQNSFSVLTNKCSLDRVSECTEPTNSVETLVNETTRPSLLSVSSFGNIDILPCFENIEKADQDAKETSRKDEEPDESFTRQLLGKYPNLTVKEKFGCLEEEILFHKWKYDANESDKLNEVPEPYIENILAKSDDVEKRENINVEEVTYITNNSKGLDTDIFKGVPDAVKYIDENKIQMGNAMEYDNENIQTKEDVTEIKEDVPEIETTLDIHDSVQVLNEETNTTVIEPTLDVQDRVEFINEESKPEIKLTSDVHKNIQIDKPISEIKEEVQIINKNIPNDKHTQITISSCDKQCVTSPKLNDYSKNDDYVLINGPVYVLKTVLYSEEKLVLYDKPTTTETDLFKEISPEKLIAESTIPFNCFEQSPVIKSIPDFDYISFYLRKNNCTKLLNSDYDLTPQRDNNTSDKYHHLLVDATTSISNMHLNDLVDKPNVERDTLLLTDSYALNNRNMAESENQTDLEDSLSQNNYMFSKNETSVDGRYEMKSYSLPKEINGSVMLSGYSVSSEAENSIQCSDQEIEIGMPLEGYEINTESDTIRKQETGKVAATSGSRKMDNYVENSVSTDTNISQSQSIRSEGERNFGLGTNQKHILGKRKLEHP